MRFVPRLLLAAGALTLLSGCSYLDTVTGQTNNKVLPGQREDAIPGRPTFPEKPDPQVGAASKPVGTGAGCASNDPACTPPTTTGDTFKDPQ
ncbi:hypothetical protein [Aestuariivirga sp.]|uniref:hypothetical protein n=1 Tax=Aestuariivirga sp. TaxID=2650926 RepID=UPI0025BEF37B|nr:hypothetical protein [Aestuariivirga sp.]MCA3554610.1 hypothetical protein [Aestuariivirga sp.]